MDQIKFRSQNLEKLDKVWTYGCKGAIGGLGLCGIAKLHYNGIYFSQEDLPIFGIAGGIGLLVGIGVGCSQVLKDRHRIYNDPVNNTSQPNWTTWQSNKNPVDNTHQLDLKTWQSNNQQIIKE